MKYLSMQKQSFYIRIFKNLIIILFLILAISQAGKKFVLDEIDFPIVAQATSQSGTPIYYRGEQNPQHIGIYHPPLYIYILAGFVKVFGYSETTIRTFGMICTMLSAYLCILIIKNRECKFTIIFKTLCYFC